MGISSLSTTLSLSLIPKPPISASRSPSFLTQTSSSFLKSVNNSGSRLSLSRVRPRKPTRKKAFSCTCLFGLGVPELAVIAGVAVLAFGPKQLPEIGRSIGKTIKSFQQAAKEFESELKKPEEPQASNEAIDANTESGNSEEKDNASIS